MTEKDGLNERFKESAEDFSLKPSIRVWENVERDIFKRARRKRYIIFSSLFAVLFISSVVWYFHQPVKNIKSSVEHTAGSKTVITAVQKPEVKKEKQSADAAKSMLATTQNGDKKEQGAVAVWHAIVKKEKSQKSLAAHTETSAKKQVAGIEVRSSVSGQRSVSSASNNIVPTYSEITVAKDRVSQTEQQSSTENALPPKIDSTATIGKTTLHTGINTTSNNEPSLKSNAAMQQDRQIDSSLQANDLTMKDLSQAKKDTIKTQRRQSKWSMALGAGPAFADSKMTENYSYHYIADYRNATDKNLMTWNYHFNINYQWIPELEIYSGLGILNFQQQMNSRQAIYHYEYIITGGYGPGPSQQPTATVVVSKDYSNINNDSTGKRIIKYTWLHIPLGIRYNIIFNNKFNIGLQPEISFNKLTSANGYMYDYINPGYVSFTENNLPSWNVALGAGIAFQYALSAKLKIEMVPIFRDFQKSFYYSSYPISEKFREYEVQFLIRYALK